MDTSYVHYLFLFNNSKTVRFGETETVAAVSNAVEEEEAALGMEEVVTKVVAGVGATNVPTTSFPRPH
jgi:hypothetical protein